MPSQFKSNLKITSPLSEDEFQKYYQTRWQILRQPWGQPQGTERDDSDITSIHRMLVTESKQVIAVARLHLNSPEQAQIRYMGVIETFRGSGAGTKLIKDLENIAAEKNAKQIVLQARENAVQFYQSNGFNIIKKTHLLFGTIQHFLMQKKIR